MEQRKKGNGCLTGGIVLGVLALLGVAALVAVPAWLYSAKRSEHDLMMRHEDEVRQGRVDGTVVFQRDAIPKFAPHRQGDELKRDQFVALMIDDLATDLARKELQRTADGTPVHWLLLTGDISDSNGDLHGNFSLPYEIRSGRSTRGSSVTLHCKFLPEAKEGLLTVRRGDWVTVEGRLSFDGRKAEISEARIVDGKARGGAEQP